MAGEGETKWESKIVSLPRLHYNGSEHCTARYSSEGCQIRKESQMSTPLRVLLVEDSEGDARLIALELEQSGYDVSFERVYTATAFSSALSRQAWDVIIADYYMPGFDGLEALRIANESGLDLPFIIASGVIGEDVAVEAMRSGAYDYVLKDHLTRLGPAVERALREAETRRARKRVEEALWESQRELVAIFDNAPVAMILVDQERRVQKANRTAVAFSARPAKEVIGLRGGEVLRCLHALDDPKGCGFGPPCGSCVVHRVVLDTFETGESRYQVEASLSLTREGEQKEVHLLVSTAPIDIAGNQLVLVSIEDITKQKRTEEALRRSEERYALAQRVANIGSWDWDVLTGDLHWSDQIEPMFGFAPGEFAATYEGFLQCVHPEDRQYVVDSVDACVNEGRDYDIEHRIVWSDGTVRWVSEVGDVVRDEDGKAIRMLGVVQDITARKRAEEEIGNLAKFPGENPSPVLRIASDCTILYANEASSPLLESWGSRVGLCLSNEWYDLILGVLTSGTSEQVEVEVDDCIVSLTFAPVAGADYVNVYGLDITERRRAEERLRQYTAELEARNEELDAFAHTTAHDLKNPLGLVIGYADILTMDYLELPPEDVEEYVREIARNGRRMGRIIDELLLLAGVRRVEVEVKPLDMEGIVRESLQRLVDMIESYQAEIVMPETWPAALGYGPWIEEVWVNYLDNAIKYGGRPPRVELGAEELPDGDGPSSVRFWVRDNGPGLSSEEQGRLFRPFTRLDQAHTKGHGLGLSIVRRIVEKLGGQVGVANEEGEGSIFSFTLPSLPETE
jgi:PAS domain S-box-containing protein